MSRQGLSIGSTERSGHVMRFLLFTLTLFAASCAQPLIERGGVYAFIWPGAQPDATQVLEVLDDGWFVCQSVTEPQTGIWLCKLNTVVYFTRVTPHHPPAQTGTSVTR